MDILEVIRTRKNKQKYEDNNVEKEKLFKALETGSLATSAMSRQPYNLILVTKPKEEKLSSTCNKN